MKQELKYIGEKIIENAYQLSMTVGGKNLSELEREKDDILSSAIHVEYRKKIFELFGISLFTDDMENLIEKVDEWSNQAAEIALHSGLSISDSLRVISSYRTVVWEVFTKELAERQFAAITILDVSKTIDPLLDRIGRVMSEVYERHNTNLMNNAYSALEELSVPVVPVTDGVAIIPIVGSIDTQRAMLIMEVSLNESARLNLTDVILDVSGVPIIDTMVANQIFQIISALNLTGVKAYLTGIRPEIAQTIVGLGVDFSHINTRANMRQALSEIGFKKVE
ncbi:STAS domain-containing protein [Peribacillus kribbensis]|uniref:STAS domain-containing protein n=1 Tax=Peribacillus kribbensis TaxID=356658 RepID=UPI0003FE58BF|nr:STAS domain-containing protein [Peribacillus kribbensis]